MKYKEFTLDPFQIEAYDSLEKGNSVVVSAATGTGKTLIADFVINRFIPDGRKVVYTSPIKALSNQKYRDFSKEYGKESVGILTGDVQINPNAPLLIMTTEIYRNMLVSQDPWVNDVEYVIFDEVHYLSDFERGTIWEEAIIFSPPHVRFLCLSATIPNAREFADWIHSVGGHRVDVVESGERAVPLKHYIFDDVTGLCTAKQFRNVVMDEMERESRRNRGRGKSRKKGGGRPAFQDHRALVYELQAKDMLPALIFTFSRKDCQRKANDLAGSIDLSTPESRSAAKKLFKEHLEPELYQLESVRDIENSVMRGIGVHHAGLLPGLKLVVETMFSQGLLKVLYATETFALGVNMPARTVGFLGLRKYDGYQHRSLHPGEFFQCAGRAGRRGMDTVGYVVALVPRAMHELKAYNSLLTRGVDPIISSFSLSYNTVINLVENHSPAERDVILRSSFDYYTRKKEKKHMWIKRRYNQYHATLNNLGYLDGDSVTEKGLFASKIYTNELVVSQIFASNLHTRLDEVSLAILLAALIYEGKPGHHFKFDKRQNRYGEIVGAISHDSLVASEVNFFNIKRLCLVVRLWCQGESFTKIMGVCNLAEGDLIRLFRNILDLASQVRRASADPRLRDDMDRVRDMIDRGVVEVGF